jgi:hypothetical protein
LKQPVDEFASEQSVARECEVYYTAKKFLLASYYEHRNESQGYTNNAKF